MSIQITTETSAWNELGQELSSQFGKKIVSGEFKRILMIQARKVAKAIKPITPKDTGRLRKSVGTKGDRYRSGNVYAMAGFKKPGENAHQFFVTLGTKRRATQAGANRGIMPAHRPDIFQSVQKSMSGVIEKNVRDAIADSVARSSAKYDAKYGRAWRKM